MLDEEQAANPKEDWNKPATFICMFSRVGTQKGIPETLYNTGWYHCSKKKTASLGN